MTPDLVQVSAIIEEIADAEIAERYHKLGADAVRAKDGPNDLVTIADEIAEGRLREALLALTPNAAFIGEEAAAADPAITRAIRTASQCWIVDPLDGTRNFVNGVDEFGSIVAYVEAGRTRAGWIRAIPDRATAMGALGAGVTYGGAPIRPKPQAGERALGLRSTGWLTPPWRERLVARLKSQFNTKAGHCSAYAYLKLLAGEVDFKLSSRIHAWDHAAGALMLKEAGGEVRWLDTGEDYAPGESRDHPLLATAPGRRWADIARQLLD